MTVQTDFLESVESACNFLADSSWAGEKPKVALASKRRKLEMLGAANDLDGAIFKCFRNKRCITNKSHST
jgi:hypothetical protein